MPRRRQPYSISPILLILLAGLAAWFVLWLAWDALDGWLLIHHPPHQEHRV